MSVPDITRFPRLIIIIRVALVKHRKPPGNDNNLASRNACRKLTSVHCYHRQEVAGVTNFTALLSARNHLEVIAGNNLLYSGNLADVFHPGIGSDNSNNIEGAQGEDVALLKWGFRQTLIEEKPPHQ